jgi:hypothetical protein
MKHGVRSLAALVAFALLGLGFSFAQDEVLQRYGTALGTLQQSVATLGEDSVRSRDLLDSAAGSLRLLAPQTSSPNLIAEMEQVVERARSAIQNHSRTDLEVQVAVLRGGFQRAVLESALLAATDDYPLAKTRFLRLAADLQLDAAGTGQLEAAGDVRQLRAAFDSAAARRIALSLEQVQEQYPVDPDRAYTTLADAYGRFLHVQDAPASDAGLNDRFMSVIGNLVSGEDSQLAAEAATLAATFREMGAAAAPDPAPAAPAATETASAAEPAAPELPDSPPEAALQAPEAAAEAGAETEAEAEPAAGPDLTLAEAAGLLEEERQAEVLADLRSAVARMGVRGQAGETAAANLHAAGFTSPDEAFDMHYALAARLAGAAAAGDMPRSGVLLERFDRLYRSTLSTVFSHAAPAGDSVMLDLTAQLKANAGLRLSDVQLLSSQLDTLTGGVSAGPGLLQQAQLAVSGFTIGWPRLILTILAGLLAIVPLVLLGMAFGGGNRNWQLINSGIFILLLPLIYEGLTYLGEFLAGVTGLAWLQSPVRFSLFHSPLIQVVWLVLMLAAIILMSIGLYGICVQFGLFSGTRARQSVRAPRRATGAGKLEVKTLIDWDDEF